MYKRLGMLVTAALIGLTQLSVAAPERLDNQLNSKMDSVVAALKKKYKNVGVLKFRVQDGLGKETFNSPMSGRMVDRIEALLMIHNADKESQALGVIRDVPRVASKYKIGAWYHNPSERKKLFAHKYPLAWGSKTVTPDAFVTGKVTLSKDGKQTSVALEVFDRSNLTPRKLTTIDLKTDRFVIRDLGYSFAIAKRGRKRMALARNYQDEDQEVVQQWLQQNQQFRQQQQQQQQKKGKQQSQQQPQADPSNVGGVVFEILADDQPVSIRSNAAQGDVARWQFECPPDQAKVTMRLKNTSDQPRAVVLRVNGKNTINDQLTEPENAAKWVLKPGKSYLLRGTYLVEMGQQTTQRGKKKVVKRNDDNLLYQETEEDPQRKNQPLPKSGAKIRPFRIVSGDQVLQMQNELGETSGWIDVDVYEPGTQKQQDVLITPKGLPPSQEKIARSTYHGLRSALLRSSKLKTIVKEEKRGNVVVKRSFIVPDTTEIDATENIKITDFPNSQFLARVTIKVLPSDVLPTDQ